MSHRLAYVVVTADDADDAISQSYRPFADEEENVPIAAISGTGTLHIEEPGSFATMCVRNHNYGEVTGWQWVCDRVNESIASSNTAYNQAVAKQEQALREGRIITDPWELEQIANAYEAWQEVKIRKIQDGITPDMLPYTSLWESDYAHDQIFERTEPAEDTDLAKTWVVIVDIHE